MDSKTFFDFPSYIAMLTHANRLAVENNFKAVTCSGINYLEGLLQHFQTTANFVAVSDVCDESTLQVGGGWMKRRLITVFILSRYKYGDTEAYHRALTLCRELYRQFFSRLLHEADDWTNDHLFLNLADVRSTELGGQFLNGATGLYFMLTMDEPTDVSFADDEWQSTFDATFDATFC